MPNTSIFSMLSTVSVIIHNDKSEWRDVLDNFLTPVGLATPADQRKANHYDYAMLVDTAAGVLRPEEFPLVLSTATDRLKIKNAGEFRCLLLSIVTGQRELQTDFCGNRCLMFKLEERIFTPGSSPKGKSRANFWESKSESETTDEPISTSIYDTAGRWNQPASTKFCWHNTNPNAAVETDDEDFWNPRTRTARSLTRHHRSGNHGIGTSSGGRLNHGSWGTTPATDTRREESPASTTTSVFDSRQFKASGGDNRVETCKPSWKAKFRPEADVSEPPSPTDDAWVRSWNWNNTLNSRRHDSSWFSIEEL